MEKKRPHVVIVGAGFGGLAAAKALRNVAIDVTIVDRRNHHLFQPLLYQVATAGLSPADIAAPIRSILSRQRNARVILDEVCGVEPSAQRVLLGSGDPLSYDFLLIATGARHSYFGHDGWAGHAPGIKSLEDAIGVRRRVLLALERAETEQNDARRRALLTYVVIGGGPTGVEMAGAIAELARRSVRRDFRTITPHCSRILLIEGGPRLLPAFPEVLSETARRSLEKLGVEIRLDTLVTGIKAEGVATAAAFVPAHTMVWAAGVQASPAATWLDAQADSAGRVVVGQDLRVPGRGPVYVIGDTALALDEQGQPLPGVAPVAKQQGKYVAQAIRAALAGSPAPQFRYRDPGKLATIGRSHAVIDFGWLRLSGFAAWALWSTAHIWFLIGFRSRLVVSLSWLWSYLTFQRGARLITGEIPPSPRSAAAHLPKTAEQDDR